jgi:hypothetical protein
LVVGAALLGCGAGAAFDPFYILEKESISKGPEGYLHMIHCVWIDKNHRKKISKGKWGKNENY